MLAMPSLPIPAQGNRSMDHPLLLFVNGGLALTHSASMCRGMTACLGAFALRPRSLPWPRERPIFCTPLANASASAGEREQSFTDEPTCPSFTDLRLSGSVPDPASLPRRQSPDSVCLPPCGQEWRAKSAKQRRIDLASLPLLHAAG